MVQINYTRAFKDGKWSEGYNEVASPYKKETIKEKIQKMEKYLKVGKVKEADQIYNQISKKYPFRFYNEMKNKYSLK